MVITDGKPSAMTLPILKLRHVLIPLDGSSFSERALPYAAELTGAAGARLSLIHTPETHHRLRGDISALDVVTVVCGIGKMMRPGANDDAGRWRRLVGVILDGPRTAT